jgi:hypothetical protein
MNRRTIGRRAHLLAGTLITLGLLASCSPRLYVWLLPGSTLQQLIFVFGDRSRRESPLAVERFELLTCDERAATIRAPGTRWTEDERAVWQLRAVTGTTALSRVGYGEVPAGFHAPVSPGVLAAGGCYFARVRAGVGGGETVFRVNSDGSLRELTDREIAALYDSWRREPGSDANHSSVP